jgi:NADPH:quinone reductase-like Zn-dependent oxidoreductase
LTRSNFIDQVALGCIAFWLGTERPEDCKAALVRLANLVAEGHLRTPIDTVLPWTEVDKAAARLVGRAVDGKIVVEVA